MTSTTDPRHTQVNGVNYGSTMNSGNTSFTPVPFSSTLHPTADIVTHAQVNSVPRDISEVDPANNRHQVNGRSISDKRSVQENKIIPSLRGATSIGTKGPNTDPAFVPSNTESNPSHITMENPSDSSLTEGVSCPISSYQPDSMSTTSLPSKATGRQEKLTIDGKWKADTLLKEKQNSEKSRMLLLPTIKWIVTIVLAACILVCLVVTKLATVQLSTKLKETKDNLTLSNKHQGVAGTNRHLVGAGNSTVSCANVDKDRMWERYVAHFILIYLALTIPAALNFIRAIWNGLLDKSVPWPTCRSVLWVILAAALESFGLCLMCYSVLGNYEAPISILLLSTPVLFATFIVLILKIQGQRQNQPYPRRLSRFIPLAMMLSGALFAVASGALIVVLVIKSTETDDDKKYVWHTVLAVLSLTLAWLPSLQQRTIVLPAEVEQQQMVESQFGDSQFVGTSSYGSIPSSTSSDMESQDRQDLKSVLGSTQVKENNYKLASWKASFVSNGFKIILIFITSFFLLCFDSGVSVSDFFGTDTIRCAFIKAWNFDTILTGSSMNAFGLVLGLGLVGYVLSYAVCHMNMGRVSFAPALLLASPVSIFILLLPGCNQFLAEEMCDFFTSRRIAFIVTASVCFFLSSVLVFSKHLFYVSKVLLQKESALFWSPGYNGVALDSWLFLNYRPNLTEASRIGFTSSQPKVNVFICTTMYREDESEMKQLLESIALINKAQARASDRCFDSHIILDGGVRRRELSEFALNLISLLDETLGIKPEKCTKTETPYGLKLSWGLPGQTGKDMTFNIHLKDNLLVKNKKRWSQVMYMSYILDFLSKEDVENYILTTDADVVFTPDSVEALLDLMTRDPSIGAVCARTHPMGSGVMVWYQIFEYAIGHWLQKAAEHVLGSVLCAPGCFSVYRCRALKDVLPVYAKGVESASDFLTKDMGEDRWLCTLLVQSGWRIEYCAASENSTNCPNQFDEFYKQRRRWVASTLANLLLVIKEWKYIYFLNARVSMLFIIYQALLLASTLVGPSTVILVVSGGLYFGWNLGVVTTIVFQVLCCAAFVTICLLTTQNTQLKVAKLYTFLYAIIMTAVAIGTAEQIVDDISSGSQSPNSSGPATTTPRSNQHVSVVVPLSVTTLYFACLSAIFIISALLHPRELYCLLHAVWYLLCLPSGYLVLILYSICNITDSSWGTREQTEEKSAVKEEVWTMRIFAIFKKYCACCFKSETSENPNKIEVDTPAANVLVKSWSVATDDGKVHDDQYSSLDIVPDRAGQSGLRQDSDEIASVDRPIPVEEWLPPEMSRRYAHSFKSHGFDSTLFIAGMTETELRRIGVTSRGHLHYLLTQIALIPAFEIEYKIPMNVDVWLEEIGLDMYLKNFHRCHIFQPKDMEVLKSFSRKDIEKDLKIKKDGHIKRLRYAISMLRDPTDGQLKAMRMRQVIEEVPIHYLSDANKAEFGFWKDLVDRCLRPDLKAFGHDSEVKVKLVELRNQWLMMLAVTNTLWIILLSTLATKAQLTVINTNPLGLAFLLIFGSLIIVQFLAMLVHRLHTFSHYLARIPYRCGDPLQTSWSFKSMTASRQFEDTEDTIAKIQVARATEAALKRAHEKKRAAKASPEAKSQSLERQPLLSS